ncbi:phosphopantetheine-binding protein [Chromobacterium sp. IIBBL 290-4]|nr:phosphopantetheine-binding protein [Chromobacterium sp. IIBBL 290-4]UTH74094.1 phosphopantetheine-binding protein [Chromobacterium sp. IIBBL 290-4]
MRRVLHVSLGRAEARLLPHLRLVDDLYADSMELLDMVLSLNNEFGIDIQAQDVAAMRTVADVVAVIARLTRGEEAEGKHLDA